MSIAELRQSLAAITALHQVSSLNICSSWTPPHGSASGRRSSTMCVKCASVCVSACCQETRMCAGIKISVPSMFLLAIFCVSRWWSRVSESCRLFSKHQHKHLLLMTSTFRVEYHTTMLKLVHVRQQGPKIQSRSLGQVIPLNQLELCSIRITTVQLENSLANARLQGKAAMTTQVKGITSQDMRNQVERVCKS